MRAIKGKKEDKPKSNQALRRKALRAAFPSTMPIMMGFLFLGSAYGIYMNAAGFSFLYPMIMSIVIFGGSVEFAAVVLLSEAFDPLKALILALTINARHIFYGLSMLEKYNIPGLKRLYLIFGMCDESFSINYMAEIPEDVDKGWYMFFVTALNHLYWISGATLGGIFGNFISFDTKGLEFVMVALFLVIFLEQWLREERHISSLLGLGISLTSLFIFGRDKFVIPAMALIILGLTFIRPAIDRGRERI